MVIFFSCLLFAGSLAMGDDAVTGRPDAYYEAGLWDVAARAYRSQLADPSMPADVRERAAIRLVECLVRDGRPVEALDLLRIGRPAAGHPAAPFWRGQALAGSGRFAEAVSELARHREVRAAPHRLESALTSANLQISLGQASSAILTLASFAETAPPEDAARANLQRTAILLDSGYPEDADTLLPDESSLSAEAQPLFHLVRARLKLASGDASGAAEVFADLLRNPAGQTLEMHHAAALGVSDALAATTGPDAASRSLLGFLTANPDTPLLDAAFRRVLKWLPDSPTSTDPTLAKVNEWIPTPVVPATGLVAQGDRAAAAWPTASRSPEIAAFAMFTRAMGLQRIGTPAALHEATLLLRRLRVDHPQHFLTRRSFIEQSLWKLKAGRFGDALDLLAVAADRSRTGVTRGEVLFIEAAALAEAGNMPAAISRFEEAAERLEGRAAEIAGYNAAVASLQSDPGFIPSADLGANLRATLELERAMAAPDPSAGLLALESFIVENPRHPRVIEARLAAAERAMETEPPDPSLARAHLDSAGPLSEIPDGELRASVLRLRIAESDGNENGSTALVDIARAIMRDAPGTPAATEAALALGRHLYDAGNFNEARIVFERLAIEQSKLPEADDDLVQASFLLAARAAALGATTQSRDEALALFDRAIQVDHASLGGIAVLEKARLLIDLNRLDAAIGILRESRAKLPPADPLALPAGLLLGEAVYAKAAGDVRLLEEALAIYDELLDGAADEMGGLYHRLQYLRGIILEKLPREDAPDQMRDAEAIEAYYSVILRAGDQPPVEWEWFERCAFAALALLEKAERWQAAINLARRIASFNGPRASDAAERAAQLQLKHMIWED